MISYLKEIENNTWTRVDIEFLFECSIRYPSEISSWTGEEKFHIYKQPYIILFII